MSTPKRTHFFTSPAGGLVDTYPGTDDGFPPVKVTYRRANFRRAHEHRQAVLACAEAGDNLGIFEYSAKLLSEHVKDMELFDENGDRVEVDLSSLDTYIELQDGNLFNWLVDNVLHRLKPGKSKNSSAAPGSSSSAPNSPAEPAKNAGNSSTTEKAAESSPEETPSDGTTSAENS